MQKRQFSRMTNIEANINEIMMKTLFYSILFLMIVGGFSSCNYNPSYREVVYTVGGTADSIGIVYLNGNGNPRYHTLRSPITEWSIQIDIAMYEDRTAQIEATNISDSGYVYVMIQEDYFPYCDSDTSETTAEASCPI